MIIWGQNGSTEPHLIPEEGRQTDRQTDDKQELISHSPSCQPRTLLQTWPLLTCRRQHASVLLSSLHVPFESRDSGGDRQEQADIEDLRETWSCCLSCHCSSVSISTLLLVTTERPQRSVLFCPTESSVWTGLIWAMRDHVDMTGS